MGFDRWMNRNYNEPIANVDTGCCAKVLVSSLLVRLGLCLWNSAPESISHFLGLFKIISPYFSEEVRIMSEQEIAQVSEAEIAVHWQEEAPHLPCVADPPIVYRGA